MEGPKLIHRYSAVIIRIPAHFVQIDKLTLKSRWSCKGSRTILIKKERVSGLTCPNFTSLFIFWPHCAACGTVVTQGLDPGP